MDLHAQYPALSDLRNKTRKRLPHFVWEFLDSGTGEEHTLARNRAALNKVLFRPSILHGEVTPDLTTTIMGQSFSLPLGVGPVGMSGLIWPDAERLLAQTAKRAGIAYTLAMAASQTPEAMTPHIGDNAWFQLYPPRDEAVRSDVLKRAKAAGFSTLVLTVDIPAPSRRERQVRSGLTQPPRLTPRLLAQVARRPEWALGMARMGMPRMRLIDDYTEKLTGLSTNAHAAYLLRKSPDWDYLRWLREHWQGPLVVKGVLRAEDAPRLEAEGIDAIWVSNHAGRQFDAAPATIEVLPEIRAATRLPIILDSGIETGLDIMRALALGANFVMMGRGFHYALGALGPRGPDHLVDLLIKDIEANMGQLGARTPGDLEACLVT